uniref:ATP synthase F0 subunit b n=1 Tax=Balbiania investiens TaxID=111861 RepID=A0A4D6BP57_9FLOR
MGRYLKNYYLIMNYIILITLLLLLLISQNILLLNEETLLLICFITFCYLVTKSISSFLETTLDTKSTKIYGLLKNSFDDLVLSIKLILSIKIKFWTLFENFNLLKTFCITFMNVIVDRSILHKSKLSKISFPKRLQFALRIEDQVTRLLTILLVRKLQKIVELKWFYTSAFMNPYFMCAYKVNIREYIQVI